jgi:hypothetical protein
VNGESPVTIDCLSEFASIARKHEVFFYYSGYFSQPIIEASADAIQLRLEKAALAYKVQRRVLSCFIEMAQNIVHYSADALTDAAATTDEVRAGTILIAETGGGLRLTCSNPVDRKTYERLDTKLSVLSKMSAEEIREAYRSALRAQEGEASSKGGGIGLLTLVRGAAEPVAYAFAEDASDPDRVIFNLSVTL